MRFRKRLLPIIGFSALVFISYLFIDFRGPAKILLRNDTAFGFNCLKARDLVVQEYDSFGNLWATRGMIIYRLKNGNNKFERIAHVPTGLTIFWLRNFSIVRKLTIRPECIELVTTKRGDICALSAGRLWIKHSEESKFRKKFCLPHYGIGDQGIRNAGIMNDNDNAIYLGEYYTNPDRNAIKVYRYSTSYDTLEVAYNFPQARVRHVHSIQKDPFTGKIWICTGDSDEESTVSWSDDGIETLNVLVSGRQMYRVCQLVFTEGAIFWGTDTGSEAEAGIFKWDKANAELTKLLTINGAIFFGTRLKSGTIVMSSNREGMRIEKDDKTRLFIITRDDKIASVECGTWNHKKPGFWFKYAMLRIQRDQGGTSLAITCLNQKEFPDSELIIISENTIISEVSKFSDIPR